MASPVGKRNIPLWGILVTVEICLAAVLAYVAIQYGFSAIPGFLLFCLGFAVVLPIIVFLSTL
jgi:hypothetical protein